MRARTVVGTLSATGLSLLLSGCGAADQGDPASFDGETDEARSELFSNESFEWDGHGVTDIPVCWNAGGGDPEHTAPSGISGHVKDTIRRNWQRYADVNFTSWGTCPSSFSGIRIQINNRGAWGAPTSRDPLLGLELNGWYNRGKNPFVEANTKFGGSCSGGPSVDQYCDTDADCGGSNVCERRACSSNTGSCSGRSVIPCETDHVCIFLGVGTCTFTADRDPCVQDSECGSGRTCRAFPASTCSDPANFETCNKSLSVHEFGHALGYWHEEERPDYTTPAGTHPNCAPQPFGEENWDPRMYGYYDINSVMSYCGQALFTDWKTELSPGDIAAHQRAYGRRSPGTLINQMEALCASKTTGAPETRTCDSSVNQTWHAALSGNDRMIRLTSSECLAPASATHGSPISLQSCSSTRDWAFENVYIRGWGGLCLDLPGGNTTSGTRLQLWRCDADGGANQKWSITGQKIRFKGYSGTKCLQRNASNQLVISDCSVGTNFSFDTSGRFVSSGLCMDVMAQNDQQYISGEGLPSNGLQMQFSTCSTALNQGWNVSGQIRWGADHSFCLARGNSGPHLNLETCGTGIRQKWDYYLVP